MVLSSLPDITEDLNLNKGYSDFSQVIDFQHFKSLFTQYFLLTTHYFLLKKCI